MGLQRFPFCTFEGGLNLIDPEDEVLGDECVGGSFDCDLSREGSIGPSFSSVVGGGVGLPAGARNIKEFEARGPGQKIASVAGDIWISQGAFPNTMVLLFNSAGNTVWTFEDMQSLGGNERVWGVNGVDPPKKILTDGTIVNWTNPPTNNASICRSWKNMMVTNDVGNPNRLHWSDIGNPEAGLTTNFIDIGARDEDSDEIIWIEVCQDNLLVFKKRSLWVVFDPVNFDNRRLADVGCEYKFQTGEYEGICYFYNRQGIFATDGNDPPVKVSGKIDPLFFTFSDSNFWWVDPAERVSESHIEARLMVTPDGRILVSYCTLSGAPNNDRVLEGWIHRKKDGVIPWMVHKKNLSALTILHNNSDGLSEVIGAHPTGDNLRGLIRTVKGGQASPMTWVTGWRGMLTEEPFERIRRINIWMEGTFDVSLFKDYDSVEAITDTLSALSSTAGPSRAQLEYFRPEKRGRTWKLRLLENTQDLPGIHKNALVHGVEFALRGGKEHR